ncbi:hypothetical protein BCR44DRAFT_374097, partial [Catenaria anguillulae PL171]
DFAAACKTNPWGSLLEHLTQAASQSIECAPAPSSSNVKAAWPLCLTLARFAHRISVRTPLSAAVVLGACVYLRRVKQRLPPSARGIPTTHHRLLLASLLISSKMLHDHQIKNCTWAQAVGLALVEVNLMERQMLGLLEFNVTLHSSELEAEFDHVNPAKFPGYTSYGSGTWPRIAPCSSTAQSLSTSLSPMSVSPGWPASPASTTLGVVGERQHNDDNSTAYNSPALSPAWSDNTLHARSPNTVGGKSSQATDGICKRMAAFNDSSVDLPAAAAASSSSPHSHSLVLITRPTPASPALARLGSAPATTATCTATVAAARAIKSSRRDSGICDIDAADAADAAELWKLAVNATPSTAVVSEYMASGSVSETVQCMSAGAGC